MGQGRLVPALPLTWFNQCHVKVLANARTEAASVGVTHKTIVDALRPRSPQDRKSRDLYIRANYQKEAYEQLIRKGQDNLNVEERHRVKQKRWNLQLPPRIAVVRAVSLFKRLGTLVKPRVVSSVARSHWNSWCTRRRFQQEGACVFHCSPSAADSIEHYPFCRVFVSFVDNFLHLPRMASLQDFLLLDHRLWSDTRLVVAALGAHALYTAFNHARLHGPHTVESIQDFMQRSCYLAVRNHARSSAAFATAVNNSRHWWQ